MLQKEEFTLFTIPFQKVKPGISIYPAQTIENFESKQFSISLWAILNKIFHELTLLVIELSTCYYKIKGLFLSFSRDCWKPKLRAGVSPSWPFPFIPVVGARPFTLGAQQLQNFRQHRGKQSLKWASLLPLCNPRELCLYFFARDPWLPCCSRLLNTGWDKMWARHNKSTHWPPSCSIPPDLCKIFVCIFLVMITFSNRGASKCW